MWYQYEQPYYAYQSYQYQYPYQYQYQYQQAPQSSSCTNPLLTGNGNMLIPLVLIRRREPTKWVAAGDAAFAVALLVFHGLTLMVQELPDADPEQPKWNRSMLLPEIPMTPGGLFITGYMEVIAWIAILSVNFLQLVVAVSLFNACEENADALKAYEASLVWLKTCVFLMIILSIKLCVLYFMHAMDMQATYTIVFSALEMFCHIIGFFVVMKFYEEIKRNYPMTSQIYSRAEEETSEGEKRKNVADAVWC